MFEIIEQTTQEGAVIKSSVWVDAAATPSST
jgi:hypothetical protein